MRIPVLTITINIMSKLKYIRVICRVIDIFKHILHHTFKKIIVTI